ncbi:MAG: 1-deoxy-D-xylulose-5-phosphate reductoisomerase [Desulfobacterales bacterium]|nr:1-deoxy-D-xylulose-5-phosphate reductoisomerase [Desulfobacterales bacterium]MBS3754569.1 1-deoxy-D-xylulose-5-phosphate reductoisomerase [Desulfobacterales bacterium]
MSVRQIGILGSTGSIGQSTLSVLARFPERFAVRALTAGGNIDLLARQIREFGPDMAVVYDEAGASTLRRMLPADISTEIFFGADGYRAAAEYAPLDTVVSAMVGSAGLLPTLAAICAGKDVALANKETLVMAGDLVIREAAARGVRILPVDSEHSAIFQCICGNREEDINRILLTASGGPFLNLPGADFSKITPADALDHPTWQMGAKITIDSATLMNKGLEVIEAGHLFALSADQIEVVIHPQSIVHSMVAYRDGTVMAQMGLPDMKAAIAYALSCPERLPLGLSCPDFADLGQLAFQAPDSEKFPCLALAYMACRKGGTMPAVMNAANEVAVAAFLHGTIAFDRIPALIRGVMEQYEPVTAQDVEDILEADRWARQAAQALAAAFDQDTE